MANCPGLPLIAQNSLVKDFKVRPADKGRLLSYAATRSKRPRVVGWARAGAEPFGVGDGVQGPGHLGPG